MYPLDFMNAETAFEVLFNIIVDEGRVKNGTKYIRNVSIELMDPEDNIITTPWRKWSKLYADAEWKWYQSGNRNPEEMIKRAPLWETMRDDQGKVWSNYGWWWNLCSDYGSDEEETQLAYMLRLLREDPWTRRAILTHYSPPSVTDQYKQDTPCNLILNFYIEDNKVNLTIFARSIDLVFGFCNDQYQFSKLMLYVRDSLNLDEEYEEYSIGTMTYMITDLHVYKKDWNRKLNYEQHGKEESNKEGSKESC